MKSMKIPTEVVDALATYRLTRLVVTDSLLDEIRTGTLIWLGEECRRCDHVIDAHSQPPGQPPRCTIIGCSCALYVPRHPKLAELLECPWCVSIWIAAGVVAARRIAPRLWGPIAALLAASTIAGVLSRDDG